MEFAVSNTVQSYSSNEMLFGIEQKGEVINEFAEKLLEDYIVEVEENRIL